ncbi:T9SS type A sorting domain-containing protein [Flavobacterium columnare]|uniref:Beta-agarase D n=2 Tax=Flavobacterium columnare TaxID=996 RepID=A0A2N9P8J5_9FLAO|nr:T9SS type A sorting domain-containing protein [Flavobacterium columnare]RVU90790.1 T9SS C-terminal target domain-containing protein [Flavobacterium columnare]SPE76658.1 Beta-agarase D precursor [Flavobacterium columnare]
MKKIYVLGTLLLAELGFCQVSISALNTPYTQDFNTMTNGTTPPSLPPNWFIARLSGTSTTALTLTNNDGSANSGGVYATGTNSSNERSLAVLASSGTIPGIGLNLINNLTQNITQIEISGKSEQWRLATSTVVEKIAFAYSYDATSLSTGTWTTVTNCDLVEQNATTNTSPPTVANIDGNALGNNSNFTYTFGLTGNGWSANGGSLWIRWSDTNDVGNDAMIGLDDFSIQAKSTDPQFLSNEKLDAISGLQVYPNPTHSVLNITSNSFSEKQIELYNLLGKIALSTKTTNQIVDITSLAKGVYIAKVTEEGKVATRKIVIE